MLFKLIQKYSVGSTQIEKVWGRKRNIHVDWNTDHEDWVFSRNSMFTIGIHTADLDLQQVGGRMLATPIFEDRDSTVQVMVIQDRVVPDHDNQSFKPIKLGLKLTDICLVFEQVASKRDLLQHLQNARTLHPHPPFMSGLINGIKESADYKNLTDNDLSEGLVKKVVFRLQHDNMHVVLGHLEEMIKLFK